MANRPQQRLRALASHVAAADTGPTLTTLLPAGVPMQPTGGGCDDLYTAAQR